MLVLPQSLINSSMYWLSGLLQDTQVEQHVNSTQSLKGKSNYMSSSVLSNVGSVNVKISRKTIITLVILVSIAVILSVYTSSAYHVASYVHEINGALSWPTPGYTFLPWPTTATGIVPQMIVQLNQTDLQYYNYIIKSEVLFALTLLLWAIVFWKAWRTMPKHTVAKP
jgi:hypothetical protein